MAKEHSHSMFQLSKDEKLVSSKDGKIIVGTARFLKPCVQTVLQAITVPNNPLLFEIFSQNLKQWPGNVEIKGWHIPQKRWEEWVDRMAGKYGALWKLTGICDAIMSSRYEIRCNKDLLLGLVEFWCPETNTFVFPWGEATVTLEDVMILGGFSTLGASVTRPLEGKLVKTEEEMNKKHLILTRSKSRKAAHGCWINYFMEEEEESEFEHVAFLSLWLSRYVFPSLPEKIVAKQVFPVAIHLSSKTRMALAPAVLASLYKNLTLLKNQAMSYREGMTASGPLKLLQLWAFERFPSLGPSIPNILKPGEPRAARFHRLNAKISLPLIRSVLRLPDNFRWRPYVADLKNWGHPSYYKEPKKFVAFNYDDPDEDLKSFARCLHASVLVGIDCKEDYLPHRVAMQLGYDQDLPAAFPVSSFSWENARFAVLPRSFQPCVSVRYFNWWARSMSAPKAALRDIKRNQNRSSPSALAKRNVENCPHSIEFGVKKPKTSETKVSIKAEIEGCCSSFANEYAAKKRTHIIQDCNDEVDFLLCSSQKIIEPHVSPPVQVERTKVSSKDPAAMCSFKSTNAFSQFSADNNSVGSHVSAAPELPFKVKRQAYEEHSDTDDIPLSERMKHVSGTPKRKAGIPRASPCSQFRITDSPTSKVPNGNVRKRSKASALTFDGSVRRQMNGAGSDKKLKSTIIEGTKTSDQANDALDVSEHRGRVGQKKRFEGSPKGTGQESKTRMAQGFPKNSENVTFKDTTTSGSIQKFGLELEGRLRRLEKLAGIALKN
ncbi:hypothetical protein REPUB_Repub05bG0034400 [Reevesia pubescens]